MTEAAQSATAAETQPASAPTVVDPSSMKPNDGESIGDYARRVQKAQEAIDFEASEGQGANTDEDGLKVDPKPDDPKKDSPVPDVKELQKLAKDGKYKEVLEALGIEVEGTKIPSDRFAKFRRMQKVEKEKLEARAKQVTQKEQAVNQQVAAVLRDYEGFSKAKRAWDDGDVVGAIEAAFGETLDAISDKALKQKLSSDPEVHKLRRRLETKEQEEKKAQEEAQRVAAQREQAKQEAAYIENLAESLQTIGDPTIAKASKKPDFVRAVFNAQMHAFHTEGVELLPDEAAERVIKTLRDAHLSWSEVFGSSSASAENTDETGKQSLHTSQAGRSPESVRKQPKGVPLARAKVTPAPSLDDLPDDERWTRLRQQFIREARMGGQ
jgi:hypothetical protein